MTLAPQRTKEACSNVHRGDRITHVLLGVPDHAPAPPSQLRLGVRHMRHQAAGKAMTTLPPISPSLQAAIRAYGLENGWKNAAR